MEVDHTDEITRCVCGGMVGYGPPPPGKERAVKKNGAKERGRRVKEE